jgi:glycosyltransferase involved in cell wall biosynthesis
VAARLRADGVEVSSLGMRRGVPSLAGVRRLAGRIDAFGPALVHSHMFHANLLARAARLLRPRVPLVNSSHVDERGVPWQHRAYRASAPLCARFHCVSRAALESLARSRAVPRARLVHIPNGVPEPGPAPEARARLRAELGLDASFVFLCAGRLHPAKDPANLVAAFARVAAEQPAARLVIAGSGPLEPEVRRDVERRGLGPQVRILGERSDVPELLAAADALVIASHSEALPLVLLEAGLARLAVAATAVGDVPALVDDGRSGLLCPARDPDALARRMLELLRADPTRRTALGEALRTRVRAGYALEAIVERWEALYAEVCARR